MEKGRVFTGARCRFLLNGKKVGYGTNVSASEEIEYQPIDVLDNIETEEFVPTAYRVTLQASFVRIVGETVKSAGYFPSTGQDAETHLANILLSEELVAVLEDNKTNKKIATIQGVQMSSQNFTINARGVVGKDATFVARRMLDESEA